MTDSKPMRAELVDDYRIKCALLLEEVIDAEEAAKLANAENDDLRREVAATTKHAQLLNKMLGEADARAERLRVALTKAHNDLDISPLTDKEREAVVDEISAAIEEDDKQ